MKETVLQAEAFLFEAQTATLWKGISRGGTRGHQLFAGRNPLSITQSEPSNSPTPLENGAFVDFYIRSQPKNKPELKICSLDGTKKYLGRPEATPGINRFQWNLRFSPLQAQQESMKRRMVSIFEELEELVSEKDSEKLKKHKKTFQEAETVDEWNRLRRDLIRDFSQVAPSPRFFGNELRGPVVEAGIYRITLTVDEKTYETILRVRPDPLFKNEPLP
jgi:hypothetical protein